MRLTGHTEVETELSNCRFPLKWRQQTVIVLRVRASASFGQRNWFLWWAEVTSELIMVTVMRCDCWVLSIRGHPHCPLLRLREHWRAGAGSNARSGDVFRNTAFWPRHSYHTVILHVVSIRSGLSTSRCAWRGGGVAQEVTPCPEHLSIYRQLVVDEGGRCSLQGCRHW